MVSLTCPACEIRFHWNVAVSFCVLSSSRNRAYSRGVRVPVEIGTLQSVSGSTISRSGVPGMLSYSTMSVASAAWNSFHRTA